MVFYQAEVGEETMKLLVVGLLLVMLECCSCKPFELGGGVNGNVGVSARFNQGVRLGLDGDAGWRLNVGSPASGQAPQEAAPATTTPAAPTPAPYDPRSAQEKQRSLYENEQRPRYGYDQSPPYGYDQSPPYGYDQRPPQGYDQRPPYGYDQRYYRPYYY